MGHTDPDDPIGIPYLSNEWFRLADEALSNLRPIPEPVTVAVRVTPARGVDDVETTGSGIIHYRLVLGPDRVRMIADDEPGDVRLTMSFATASAIARGDAGAQRAFLNGEVQLGGDTTALLGHQDHLSQIDDQLVPLRDRTIF
jgi:hypothetical protein